MDRRSFGSSSAIRLLAALLLLLLTFVAVTGCSSGPPPDQSLKQLGAQLGGAPQDTVDFPALLKAHATDHYATTGEAGFVKYRLFIAGKAADLALNKGKTDVVKVEQKTSGDHATVTMLVQKKEGIFSVAPVSSITVNMRKVDDSPDPWRIDEIALAK